MLEPGFWNFCEYMNGLPLKFQPYGCASHGNFTHNRAAVVLAGIGYAQNSQPLEKMIIGVLLRGADIELQSFTGFFNPSRGPSWIGAKGCRCNVRLGHGGCDRAMWTEPAVWFEVAYFWGIGGTLPARAHAEICALGSPIGVYQFFSPRIAHHRGALFS